MHDSERPKLAMSYVSGTSLTPLRYQTIGQLLDEATAAWPDREALVSRHQNVRWTYRQLAEKVNAYAAGLVALGLLPGERIGIWAPNCWEWTVTQFATAKAGLILVNINPAYRLSELEYSLNKVKCKALILADRFKSSNYVEMVQTLAPEVGSCAPGALISAKLPHLKLVARMGSEKTPGFYNFEDIAGLGTSQGKAKIEELSVKLQADDPINIQFTSGTTGLPKGATLTHHNIVNNAYFVGKLLGYTEKERICIPVPLYHCFGMVLGNLAAIACGGCMVYPNDAFEPVSVLETVQAEKCTSLYGVPTMFIAELDHPNFKKFELRSLRTGLMAGAPCPIEVMKRVVSDLHMKDVGIAYGMTELSPVSFQTRLDDSIERRVSTVGRAHPHIESKIVDEDGRVAPVGVRGEIVSRGYSVMRGYWDDPERTAEAISAGGWMRTGDLGVFDADGYCKIVGRVKDMVIRGGENIFPREIEEYLYRLDKIQDVSVFGIPDEKYGEEICAWIKLKDGKTATADDIVAFCRDQIAHYKVPRHICFVDEFPMTVTGKIQKFVMRDQMIERLSLKIQKTA
jgi:fatty-acyl-CoA synthase